MIKTFYEDISYVVNVSIGEKVYGVSVGKTNLLEDLPHAITSLVDNIMHKELGVTPTGIMIEALKGTEE